MKKAALISPYLDILGGAEKYLLDIGFVLSRLNYQVEIFWPDLAIKSNLLKRFGQKYSFLRINTNWHKMSPWQKILNSRLYNVVFYHSDGSYFLSLAKHNYQLFQVPNKVLIPKNNLWNQLKFSVWTPVFNSRFTRNFYLTHTHPKKHYLLYPTIATIDQKPFKKEKIILSVARFFAHLHSKKQEVLIKAFVQGSKKYPELKSYRLVLVGAYNEQDRSYLSYLQKLAANTPNIEIKTNLSFTQIQNYYQRAAIYWHAAGYKINERKSPELVEHFGISIVEAMNNYNVPVVYRAGGPKETVIEAKSGFFFSEPYELVEKTMKLIRENKLREKMAIAAHERVENKFGQQAFINNLQPLLS